jgi:D-alanyl-D-alanine carboxypeptidase (penicillin-binding protein 5/6)
MATTTFATVAAAPAGASVQAHHRTKAELATTTPPTAPGAQKPVPSARSYVLVDVDTGNVLFGYRERLRVPPASLTKVLTALIAVGYLPVNAGVPGTEASVNVYPNRAGIEKGVAWPLHEVLQSLLVYSANDAAYAIAQRVAGTLSAFGTIMQRSAEQIGMSDSPAFHDPAGLDGTEGVDGGNQVSARDLAIAGRDLLSVPQLADIVTRESYDFVDPTGTAHDLPSMDRLFLDSYPGAIGIKTGFTDRAGSCLMAAARRNGRTMLAVVMNGYDPNVTAIDLLNEGFATPVSAERAADHLPPVAVPSPLPVRTAVHKRSHQGRASSATSPRTAGAKSTSGPDRSGAPRRLAGAAGPGRHRGGSALTSVLRTWPAQVLLALGGLAAVLALLEAVRTKRALQRRRRALALSQQHQEAIMYDPGYPAHSQRRHRQPPPTTAAGLGGPAPRQPAGARLAASTSGRAGGGPVTARQPGTRQPVARQPVARQPVARQPVARQPVARQPGTRQPGAGRLPRPGPRRYP